MVPPFYPATNCVHELECAVSSPKAGVVWETADPPTPLTPSRYGVIILYFFIHQDREQKLFLSENSLCTLLTHGERFHALFLDVLPRQPVRGNIIRAEYGTVPERFHSINRARFD